MIACTPKNEPAAHMKTDAVTYQQDGKDFEGFKAIADDYIEVSTLDIPEARIFPEPETQGKVFFTDYDMVQVEMSKIGRANEINISNFGKINHFI